MHLVFCHLVCQHPILAHTIPKPQLISCFLITTLYPSIHSQCQLLSLPLRLFPLLHLPQAMQPPSRSTDALSPTTTIPTRRTLPVLKTPFFCFSLKNKVLSLIKCPYHHMHDKLGLNGAPSRWKNRRCMRSRPKK